MEYSEHSERGAYVTHQVSVWICNDGDLIEAARAAVRVGDLARWVKQTIRSAPRYSSPWHVGQELAANDYDRVDWQSVADDLRPEESR